MEWGWWVVNQYFVVRLIHEWQSGACKSTSHWGLYHVQLLPYDISRGSHFIQYQFNGIFIMIKLNIFFISCDVFNVWIKIKVPFDMLKYTYKENQHSSQLCQTRHWIWSVLNHHLEYLDRKSFLHKSVYQSVIFIYFLCMPYVYCLILSFILRIRII